MNGRMDTLQAAVLLAKLDVFDAELAERGAGSPRSTTAGSATCLVFRSASRMHGVPGRSTPYCCRTARPETACKPGLRAEGVPSAIYYPRPLHHQPAYAARP